MTLQGSLFGEAEPTDSSAEPNSCSDDLSDEELGADAAARPRQRELMGATAIDAIDTTEEGASEDSDAPAWSHHGQVDAQQLRWTPQLTSAIARDSVLLIVRYVGAHDLKTIWECSKCNPYWYNWYCKKCEKSNTFLYWTPRKHFGHCGMSCGCCLSRAGAFWGCDACDDLLQLKATCPTMRDLLTTYKGT